MWRLGLYNITDALETSVTVTFRDDLNQTEGHTIHCVRFQLDDIEDASLELESWHIDYGLYLP